MRILLLNYEFPPMGGGAANATANIARELVQLGHRVDVLTSGLPGQSSPETVHGFTVHRVFSSRKGIHNCGLRGAATFFVSAALKLLTNVRVQSYDIVHCFFTLPTGGLMLVPGVAGKVTYVVSLRGSDVPGYDPFNRTLQFYHKLLLPVTRHIWRKAKRVVALSDSLKETALLTNPAQKIEVIGNGVEVDLFKPPATKRVPDNTFRLIAVTRLIERKGVQYVLQALRSLNNADVKLLVVGTGSYESHLRQLARELRLEDQVTFYGYCSQEQLPQLYNQSDCFILPSMAESFGIVFAEAMASGLPVIGGKTGGIPDLIKDENGILVEPENIEQIKTAIIRMMSDPGKRSAMGKANRERVLAHYSWKRVAERYVAIYQP